MNVSTTTGLICTPPENRQNPSLLSLVIPMYNEKDGLDVLFGAIEALRIQLGVSIEVVCIDDGSADGTFEALTQRQEPYIRAFRLSRNFGKEVALSAGLDMCKGDVVVPIDADLQEPPDTIPRMLEEWRKGHDVVFAIRRTREHDTKAKRLSAGLFYKFFNMISESKIPENAGDFRMMDRAVVDVIRSMPERNRFMKGLLSWPGFSTASVYFDRPERHTGDSKWKPLGLVKLAIDGLTSFSIVPLRVASICGAAVSTMAFFFALYVVAKHLLVGDPVQGYASMITVIAFLGGMQLMALGVLGEYVGRIYIESKRRPLYIISQVHEKAER
jgi:glycosyltransferase involved in cell wall biosynthesis